MLASSQRFSTSFLRVIPCEVPAAGPPHPGMLCLSFPMRLELSGSRDSLQEVAEGIEEAGEHRQQHQLQENRGVREAMGVPWVSLGPWGSMVPTSFSCLPPTT